MTSSCRDPAPIRSCCVSAGSPCSALRLAAAPGEAGGGDEEATSTPWSTAAIMPRGWRSASSGTAPTGRDEQEGTVAKAGQVMARLKDEEQRRSPSSKRAGRQPGAGLPQRACPCLRRSMLKQADGNPEFADEEVQRAQPSTATSEAKLDEAKDHVAKAARENARRQAASNRPRGATTRRDCAPRPGARRSRWRRRGRQHADQGARAGNGAERADGSRATSCSRARSSSSSRSPARPRWC